MSVTGGWATGFPNPVRSATRAQDEQATGVLALQLRFLFEMSAACFGLMGAAPERPCDDVGRLDPPLCELHGDATDFLDRPADEERGLGGGRGSVFLIGATFA